MGHGRQPLPRLLKNIFDLANIGEVVVFPIHKKGKSKLESSFQKLTGRFEYLKSRDSGGLKNVYFYHFFSI